MGGSTLLLLLARAAPAATLLGAIHRRVRETPGLWSLLPGGFHTGNAPEAALSRTPYGSIHEIDERPRWDTSGRSGESTSFQVSFFGEDPDALKAAKEAWEAAFRPGMAPLAVAGRYHILALTTGGRLAHDGPNSKTGRPMHHQVLDVRVLTGRTS